MSAANVQPLEQQISGIFGFKGGLANFDDPGGWNGMHSRTISQDQVNQLLPLLQQLPGAQTHTDSFWGVGQLGTPSGGYDVFADPSTRPQATNDPRSVSAFSGGKDYMLQLPGGQGVRLSYQPQGGGAEIGDGGGTSPVSPARYSLDYVQNAKGWNTALGQHNGEGDELGDAVLAGIMAVAGGAAFAPEAFAGMTGYAAPAASTAAGAGAGAGAGGLFSAQNVIGGLNLANSIANKNPLGILTGLAGLGGFSIPGEIGKFIGGATGLGNVASGIAGDAIWGGLGSAMSGGSFGKGLLTGGLSGGLNQYAGSLGLDPWARGALTGAGNSLIRGAVNGNLSGRNILSGGLSGLAGSFVDPAARPMLQGLISQYVGRGGTPRSRYAAGATMPNSGARQTFGGNTNTGPTMAQRAVLSRILGKG